MLSEIYMVEPKTQIIFIGSVNCLRHKPFREIAKYMMESKASILCPTMSEFASGRYITLIKDAIKELKEERNSNDFVLIYGCQYKILSTDSELLIKEVKEGFDVNLKVIDDSHLENGDHQ